ncbi:hypothetical protein [Streptomyces sp. NPDC005181]|uniref:hypothetical protein n=1 Tax=Streptomyces sp. NPDC005181 TaxID=3156869 RepID=UPI0033BDA9AF
METLVTAAALSRARQAVRVRPVAERFAPSDPAVPFAGHSPADRPDLPPPGEYAAL